MHRHDHAHASSLYISIHSIATTSSRPFIHSIATTSSRPSIHIIATQPQPPIAIVIVEKQTRFPHRSHSLADAQHTRARAHRAAGARRIHQTGSFPPVRGVTPVSATASPTARQGRAARATPLPQPPRLRPSHEQRPRTRQYRCRRVALEESSGAIHRIGIAPHQSSGETWMTIVSGHVSPSVVKRTSCEHSIPCVEQ